jgi:hypothetical protein
MPQPPFAAVCSVTGSVLASARAVRALYGKKHRSKRCLIGPMQNAEVVLIMKQWCTV